MCRRTWGVTSVSPALLHAVWKAVRIEADIRPLAANADEENIFQDYTWELEDLVGICVRVLEEVLRPIQEAVELFLHSLFYDVALAKWVDLALFLQ